MIGLTIRKIRQTLVLSLKELVKDRTDCYASGMAYFQLLSLTPVTGFVLFIFFKIFGEEKTNTELVPVLNFWFPQQFVQVMKFMLSFEHRLQPSQLSTLSWIAGILLVWGTKNY